MLYVILYFLEIVNTDIYLKIVFFIKCTFKLT